jgi:hypothetical protein
MKLKKRLNKINRSSYHTLNKIRNKLCTIFDKALQRLSFDRANKLAQKGTVALFNKDYALASSLAKRSIDLAENNSQAWQILASAALKLKDTDSFFDAFLHFSEHGKVFSKECATLFDDPNSIFHPLRPDGNSNKALALYNQASQLAKDGKYEQALAKLNQIPLDEREDWRIVALLALVKYKLNLPEFNKHLWRTLRYYNPFAPEVHIILEDMLSKPGKLGVVYTERKVGSTSVTVSLRNSDLSMFFIKTHSLDHGIEEAEIRVRNQEWDFLIAQLSRLVFVPFLLEYIKRHRTKIIVLVRELIELEISSYFFSTYMAGKPFRNTEKHIRHRINSCMDRKLSPAFWFDQELHRNFAFDVYAQPFDKDKGFHIYQHDNLDILVMKLEHLDEIYSEAMEEFFNHRLELGTYNIAEEKSYKDLYREFKGTFKVPADITEQIYNLPWMQHFYTQAEISLFRSRWTQIETERIVDPTS